MGQSLNLWRNSKKKPLFFYSKEHGKIRLNTFFSIKDFETLINHLKNQSDTSKDFTIKVLNDVVVKNPEKNLRNWKDKTLISVAKKWATAVLFIDDVAPTDIRTFDDFKRAVAGYISNNLRTVGKSIEKLNSVLAQSMKALTEQISLAVNNIVKVFDSTKLIQEALSQISFDFQKIIFSIASYDENFKSANDVLILSDYELALAVVNLHDLAGINSGKVEPAVTNKLVNMTRSEQFIAEVESLFENPLLKKRLPVFKQALLAHKSRLYYLSTPIFISQTDGIFTDWLSLIKLVQRKDGKVISQKVGKKNKTKQLNSLNARVIHAKENLNTEGLLKIAIDEVLTRSIGRRNAILHGEKTNYGTAKNSTQALIIALFFAGILESAIPKKKVN